MPAEQSLNGVHIREASADLATGNPNPSLALGGLDRHAKTSEPPGVMSPAESLGVERAERRHQRMLVREASTAARGSAMRDPDGAAPRQRASASASRLAPPGRQTLRDSVSVTLILTVVAGGILGAILGALSVAGWLIGLLVAVLTVVLVPRQHSRST